MPGRTRSLGVLVVVLTFIFMAMSGGRPFELIASAVAAFASEDCPDCALFGTIKLEPPAAGVTPPAQYLQLSQVSPESGVGWASTHDGPSVLYVDEGVLCYALSGVPTGPVHVTRPLTPAASAELMTDPPDERCADYEDCADGLDINNDGEDDARGCTLEQSAEHPAPAVLLQAGDAVTQGDTTNRYYQNVGTTTARLLFSNLQPSDTGQLPCLGGCH